MDDLLAALKEIVGPSGFLESPEDKAPYLTDVRELTRGETPLVVRPASTAEVARIVRACAGAGVPLVPQGGNTGYMQGAVPEAGQVLLQLGRLNRVRDLDPLDDTITVEAGCILAEVQKAAESVDRLFPLSLGAEGSCQIGGNLSTNAGGIHVLRYGNARDLVLGLEVVLPDGTIWDGLRRLRKDNTGYALRHLFVGAEGTLGIVTAATLKLFPRPKESATALLAVRDPRAALELLALMRQRTGEQLSAFEYIARSVLDIAFRTLEWARDPLAEPYEHYVLMEAATTLTDLGLAGRVEAALGEAFEAGLALDGTVAQSEGQAHELWRLRESLPEAQKLYGPGLKHDISVPVSSIPDFLERAGRAVAELCPEAVIAPFGHIGDGNLHYNLCAEQGSHAFDGKAEALETAVYEAALGLGGSFSAEHGIGRVKRHLLQVHAPVGVEVMRRIKLALDPENLMNPEKVV